MQLSTAWDGVALEIPCNGSLLEDGVVVAHGPPAELREIAQVRQDARWGVALAASGSGLPAKYITGTDPTARLRWETYP